MLFGIDLSIGKRGMNSMMVLGASVKVTLHEMQKENHRRIHAASRKLSLLLPSDLRGLGDSSAGARVVTSSGPQVAWWRWLSEERK